MADLLGSTITWLGHATVLIKTVAGTTILIDPFLEHNPKFPKGFVLPEKLDLILATHGHMDHIADLVPVALRSGGQVVGMPELTGWAESKGVQKTVGMNLGGSYTHADVTVSMVEAKHSSSIQDGQNIIYAGDPAGFVISVAGGPVLYHAGDTSVFSDMSLIRDLYQPTFGMLPMGGHYTMDPRGAAMAARLLGLKTVLPLHWGTFPVLTGTPAQLKQHLSGTQVEVLEVKPGEAIGR